MFHQDQVSTLGMRVESKEKQQYMISYRPGDETGRLDLRNGERGEDLHLTYLLHWLEFLPIYFYHIIFY